MSDRASDQLEETNLEEIADVSLIPWTECVGKIIDVTDDRITLQATWQISICITPDVLKKSKKILRKGDSVGILILDDGSIRVRSVSA